MIRIFTNLCSETLICQWKISKNWNVLQRFLIFSKNIWKINIISFRKLASIHWLRTIATGMKILGIYGEKSTALWGRIHYNQISWRIFIKQGKGRNAHANLCACGDKSLRYFDKNLFENWHFHNFYWIHISWISASSSKVFTPGR